jgi:hypothetical protein
MASGRFFNWRGEDGIGVDRPAAGAGIRQLTAV